MGIFGFEDGIFQTVAKTQGEQIIACKVCFNAGLKDYRHPAPACEK